MNPVVNAVLNFWHFHPIITIILGVLFFPEIEMVVGLLALFAAGIH